MSAIDQVWPFAVIAVVVFSIISFTPVYRWSWMALLAATPSFAIASLEIEIILRGFLEAPHQDQGVATAVVRGGLILASCANASLAIRNRPGPAMLIVAAVAAVQFVYIGFPLVDEILADPTAVSLQISGYDVPYWASIALNVTLGMLVFLLALSGHSSAPSRRNSAVTNSRLSPPKPLSKARPRAPRRFRS